MIAKLLFLSLPLASALNSTSSSASVTYYADDGCTKIGGGPPGLISNPFNSQIGDCQKLLSSGYSLDVTSCANGKATVTTYPGGCSGAEGPKYAVPTGTCVTSNGVHSVAKC